MKTKQKPPINYGIVLNWCCVYCGHKQCVYGVHPEDGKAIYIYGVATCWIAKTQACWRCRRIYRVPGDMTLINGRLIPRNGNKN